jgi:hypothetical protein
MKIVVRKSVKLDIPHVLGFLAGGSGVASSILIPEVERVFGCNKRAAQDALAILIAGGWLERRDDPNDTRRKTYWITDKGAEDLYKESGWRHMRWARWQHSRTSTRARNRRGAGTKTVC